MGMVSMDQQVSNGGHGICYGWTGRDDAQSSSFVIELLHSSGYDFPSIILIAVIMLAYYCAAYESGLFHLLQLAVVRSLSVHVVTLQGLCYSSSTSYLLRIFGM